MAFDGANFTEADWQMFIHHDPATNHAAWQYGMQSIDDFFAPDAPFWNDEMILNGEYNVSGGGQVGEATGMVGQGEGNSGGGGMGSSSTGGQVYSGTQQLDAPSSGMHTNVQYLASTGSDTTGSSMSSTDVFSGVQQFNMPSIAMPAYAQQLASVSSNSSITGNDAVNGMQQFNAPSFDMPTYARQLASVGGADASTNSTGNEMFSGLQHSNVPSSALPTNVQQPTALGSFAQSQTSPLVVISDAELSDAAKKAAYTLNDVDDHSEGTKPDDADEREHQNFINIAAKVQPRVFRRGRLPWATEQTSRVLRSSTNTASAGNATSRATSAVDDEVDAVSFQNSQTSDALQRATASGFATSLPSSVTEGPQQPHLIPQAPSLPVSSHHHHQQYPVSFHDGTPQQVTPPRPANAHRIAPYPSPAQFQQTQPYPADGTFKSSPPVASSVSHTAKHYPVPGPPHVSPASFGNLIGSIQKATPNLLPPFTTQPSRRRTRRTIGAEALISEMDDQQTSPTPEEGTVPFSGFETRGAVPQTKRSREECSHGEDPSTPPPKRKKVSLGRGEVHTFTTEEMKALSGPRTRGQRKQGTAKK